MKLHLSNLRPYSAPVRLVAFVLILALIWLPIAVPINLIVQDRNLAGIFTLLVLYAEFLWLVQIWGKQVHKHPAILWQYGLEFTRQSGLELLAGLGLGLISLLLMITVETGLGWVQWHPVSLGLARIVIEGLLSALALGFAEELLFRGWLLDELQRDYSPTRSLWASAIIFAAIHLRLPTFPALICLGLALVWAKRACEESPLSRRSDSRRKLAVRNRLMLPIGLHAGLIWGNYIVEVGQLIDYTHQVPPWVTGIDRNPLAGILGVAFLGAIALGMWQFAKYQHRALERNYKMIR